MNIFLMSLMGGLGYLLYKDHKKKKVDRCRGCKKWEVVKYVMGASALDKLHNILHPFCKKCKPEIFNDQES